MKFELLDYEAVVTYNKNQHYTMWVALEQGTGTLSANLNVASSNPVQLILRAYPANL